MAPGFIAVANHLLKTLHHTYLHNGKHWHLVQRCAGNMVHMRFWSSSWACELAEEGVLGFLEVERALHWFIVNSSQCGFHGSRKRRDKGRFVWCETPENRGFEEANMRGCFVFVLGTWFFCLKFLLCFCAVQQECYLSDKLQAWSVLFSSQTGYLIIHCMSLCCIHL